MMIKTDGGDIFSGKDEKAIVRQMRDSGWNAPDKKRDFIEQVSERVEQMTGKRPRRGAKLFLNDLAELELIEFAH